MNFWKRWIGDYQRDTGHLSLTEHGAYTLLLDVHYATERPLPSDRMAIYRLLRAIGKDEQTAIDSVLSQFWKETEDGWVNDRAADEIEKSHSASDAARNAAKKRWHSERNAERNADAVRTQSDTDAERNADAVRNGCIQGAGGNASHSHSHSQTPKPKPKPQPQPPDPQSTSLETPNAVPSPQGGIPSARPPARTRPGARPPPPDLDHLKSLYPERAGAQPWSRALRAANARIKEGATWDELLDGVSRYAVYCRETGKVGTEFVMQAATFLGPECHFRQPWRPPPTESEQRLRDNIAAAERAMDVLAERDGLEVSHDRS